MTPAAPHPLRAAGSTATLMPREQAAALPAPDPDPWPMWAGLAQDLRSAEFTNDRIVELIGAEAVAALDREQIVPGQSQLMAHLHAAAQAGHPPHPCAVLTGLFLLGVAVTGDQVDVALPQIRTDGLRRLGLVVVDGDIVAPAVDLRPYQTQRHRTPPSRATPHQTPPHQDTPSREDGDSADSADGLGVADVPDAVETSDLWVLSDLSAHQVDGALPDEHVLGVGQASLTLASITHRRRVPRALDIGTGCGIQLFHLLDHADHVIGTDLSTRALSFAHCNLLLNAAALDLDPEHLDERVELRQGSLLEPVAGERFDLVVSNPPFVITPRTGSRRYTYRDGGRAGDELMAELIDGLPGVLAPGGTAQMLGNWEITGGTEWSARPRRWAEQVGLEAWFIQREEQDPAEYAETWLRDASTERDLEDYRRRFAEYLEDFASRDVGRIGFGLIWLRRPEEAGQSSSLHPLHRFEELRQPIEQPAGLVLADTAARMHAVDTDAESVLNRQLVAAEDVTEERHQRFGAPDPEVILARQGAGLRRVRPVSSAAAGVLGAADGEFTVAQLITAVTTLLDDGETDVEALSESLRAEVLDLYVEGFLTAH